MACLKRSGFASLLGVPFWGIEGKPKGHHLVLGGGPPILTFLGGWFEGKQQKGNHPMLLVCFFGGGGVNFDTKVCPGENEETATCLRTSASPYNEVR